MFAVVERKGLLDKEGRGPEVRVSMDLIFKIIINVASGSFDSMAVKTTDRDCLGAT